MVMIYLKGKMKRLTEKLLKGSEVPDPSPATTHHVNISMSQKNDIVKLYFRNSGSSPIYIIFVLISTTFTIMF